MAEKTLEFYQIFYDEQTEFAIGMQTKQFYPFAIPYKSNTLTPYFENYLIAQIVPDATADLVSVCSWRLKQKRGDCHELLTTGNKPLTVDAITSIDFDVAILTPRSPSHTTLANSAQWHGESWTKAFPVFKDFLQRDLSITVPHELKRAIYENHFIAKREIYQEYVETILKPSMKFMDSDPVFSLPAGYINRKFASEREHIRERLKTIGMEDYPIGVFILERLFSIWIDEKNFNVINL